LSKKRILIFLLTILAHLSGYLFLIQRIEPFQHFAYLIFWWSYIVFIDNLFAMKTRRFIVCNKNLPFLILISSGFWCIFELINLRLENWYYINLPDYILQRWTGYLLAYGTVVPAIYVTKELIRNFLGEIKVKPLSFRNYSRQAIVLGILSLVLTLSLPQYCFPLAWVFPALIIDGYNYQRGYSSFIGELEQGFAGNLVATLLSGLICGILWETWNFWSISKWVYSVPFFENLKIFEMPLPGYFGFLFFAISTIAFVNLLQGIKVYKTYLLRATSAALVVSLLSFAIIDKETVFSYVASVDQLSFIDKEKLDAMQTSGIKTSFGIDPALLDTKEKSILSLVHLKGLGYGHYLKLKAHGIDTIPQLAGSNELTLSRILDEPNLRRIRVYLKAARQTKTENRAIGDRR